MSSVTRFVSDMFGDPTNIRTANARQAWRRDPSATLKAYSLSDEANLAIQNEDWTAVGEMMLDELNKATSSGGPNW